MVVVSGTFGVDDVSRLTGRLRRLQRPYQLIWDDIHKEPKLFAETVERLAAQSEPVRVLAAYRDYAEAKVREWVTPDFCRRIGLPAEPLKLCPFDVEQAGEMAAAVAAALDLSMDEAARRRMAPVV